MPTSNTPDWHTLRLLANQRIRARLQAATGRTLDDLSQEVVVALFRLSRREPLLDPKALVHTLVERVCADHGRRQRGERAAGVGPDSAFEPSPASPAHEMPCDMLELFRFLVLERFRELDAPCQDLATRFYAEQSWSTVADQLGLRHPTVIKRWSRCMQQVRKLVRTQQGRVWEWARALEGR